MATRTATVRPRLADFEEFMLTPEQLEWFRRYSGGKLDRDQLILTFAKQVVIQRMQSEAEEREQAGIAWFNGLPEIERRAALGSAAAVFGRDVSVADAFAVHESRQCSLPRH